MTNAEHEDAEAEAEAVKAEKERHFAPFDLTDGRRRYDWSTKWPKRAQVHIAAESLILFCVVLGVPVLLVMTWDGRTADWLNVSDDKAATFATYALAWLGGLLGGASFSLKWLYHAVAKGSWHRDRLLWRLATPLLSAGLAFAITALVRSNLFPLLNPDSLRPPSAVVAFAFVTGYFSDHAIGALLRLAQKIFGETRRKVESEGKPQT